MSDPTAAYIASENNKQRRPEELYHIWRGSTHWRMTCGDTDESYDGHTWTHAVISRGSIEMHHDMKSTTVSVSLANTNPAISSYVATTPIENAWIEIYKVFRDQSPIEARLIFVGEIIDVTIKGVVAQATCAGIEHLLQSQMLQYYYQPECNHTLFDAGCALAAGDYSVSPTITIDSTGCLLTATAFAGYNDNYFRLGKVQFGNDYRMVIGHTGDTITIQYAFPDLESGDTVTVTPGCDGNVDTCNDTFSNLTHFLGFPHIPIDNPATWINK